MPGVRFLADEDFDNTIVRGVMRRLRNVDIVRVQDIGLSGRPDPEILAWAAEDGRILLTHDVSTMKSHAYARVEQGLAKPGVFAAAQSLAIGVVLDALILIAECSLEGGWEGQVRHIPIRLHRSPPRVRRYVARLYADSVTAVSATDIPAAA